MPRIVRESEISWEGNLARGTGALRAATSGAFEGLGYSLPARIGATEGKTSPEELFAAAHGACFTMSVAGELTKVGTPPGSLDVRCVVTMDEVGERGHLIVHSALTVRAAVAGIDDAALAAAVEAADLGCPFSTLLRDADVAVEVSHELEKEV
jgi:osmotically inducible protein OsmC